MTDSITITLPADVKLALEEVSRQGGKAPSDIIEQAIKQHLFLRQFQSLRERLTAKLQGVITDQDVFNQVS